jgi:hypothetical protein
LTDSPLTPFSIYLHGAQIIIAKLRSSFSSLKKSSFIKMRKIILLVFISTTFFGACKKAGLGGGASIIAYPQHHGLPIKGATAYLKFNTQNAPGSLSEYDHIVSPTATKQEDYLKITGLKPGDYYVYMIGFDSAISLPVQGGIPFTIPYSKRNSEINLNVPITE